MDVLWCPTLKKHGFEWQIMLSVIRKLYKLFTIGNINRTLEGSHPYAQPNNFVNGIKAKEKKTGKKNETLTLKPLEIGITDHFFLAVHAATCTGQEAY